MNLSFTHRMSPRQGCTELRMTGSGGKTVVFSLRFLFILKG
uniref:Uncharacterized protein n=1 Tax=Anguilla anguilla TaxID=7936 RepID=A0A0E9VV20_ANGAN